jgi:dephospho-CoA kinase
MTVRAILSGGIGTGKSTAGDIFAALGAEIVSADEMGHRVLEPGGEAYEAVASRWPDVVDPWGGIDRRALGRIVFADPGRLAELESVTHPAIRSRILSIVDGSEAPAVLVELPLARDLLGDGWRRIVVDAPVEVRRSRLRARGMDDDEIEGRMAAQPGREAWLAWADHVVDNSSDIDHLGRECLRVWEELTGGSGPVGPDQSGPVGPGQ